MIGKNYLSTYAKSFNWAGFFLPKLTYKKCSDLYDFCRVVDNIADEKNPIEIKQNKFQEFKRKFNNLVPIVFSKGEVIFYDKKLYVASISDARIRLNFTNKNNQGKLKGKLLNDDVVINLNIEKVNDENLTELVFKLSNLKLSTDKPFPIGDAVKLEIVLFGLLFLNSFV